MSFKQFMKEAVEAFKSNEAKKPVDPTPAPDQKFAAGDEVGGDATQPSDEEMKAIAEALAQLTSKVEALAADVAELKGNTEQLASKGEAMKAELSAQYESLAARPTGPAANAIKKVEVKSTGNPPLVDRMLAERRAKK